MKKVITVFYILMLLISLNALDISGNQSGTWTLANSPYTIIGDVTVPENLSLTIEAGVEVLFAGNFRLTALGRVEAIGTEESMITFKAATDSEAVTHKGIRLEYEGAEANIFDYCLFKNGERGVNSIDSPVNITNSHFTYNDDGIHVFAIGNTNPPPILIEDNLIENSVKSGISINESSAVTITNNEITGNGTGPQFRGAIQVSIQSSSAVVEPTITHNNIHGNHFQGITCVDMFSCGGINAFISENTIDNNYTGVYFYNCTGRLVNNVITNNFIPGDMNSGAGVMCYGGGATPYIAGNQISGNYGGIFITVGAQPIIGNPDLEHEYAYGLNTIEANIDVNDVTNSVILNNLSSEITIMAKNNFWGTTDLAEIDASITDSNDDPALGTVEYLPLAEVISAYTLNLNVTSDLGDNVEAYYLQLKDYTHQPQLSYPIELGSSTLTLEEPLTFTASGYFRLDSSNTNIYEHCYYGDFDELTIVTIDNDNPEATIDLHFNSEPRPKTFRTYDYIDINGVQVLPLLKDEFLTNTVKQLVYENDNNEIMLVGYQKYGINGWESVMLEEEVLYLKNDALPGETFTGHHVINDNTYYILFNNLVEVKGVHDVNLTGSAETVEAKGVHAYLGSPFDTPVESWIEYTGNSAPLSINGRFGCYSKFFAEDDNYTGTFDNSKLLDLQPNVTVDYYSRTVLPIPTNLTIIDETLYWNPCSDGSEAAYGYQVFWEREINNELVEESFNVGSYYSVELSDLELGYGDYTLWVTGIFSDGSFSEPSNLITYTIVSNDDNSVEPYQQLLGNYPNPFNPETTIFYNLESDSRVELTIYNLKGQKVRSLVNELQPKGNHQVAWNGRDDNNKSVASGVFFYRMKSGKFSSTKKMILLK